MRGTCAAAGGAASGRTFSDSSAIQTRNAAVSSKTIMAAKVGRDHPGSNLTDGRVCNWH